MNLLRRVCSALAAGGLSLAAAYPAAAANSIFLSIPNVTGPVQVQQFKGDIELLAYTQGFTNPETIATGGGGAGSGKVNCGAINVEKLLDSSSTFFLKQVMMGGHIPTATIYFTERVNGNLVTAYTATLTGVFVTAVSQGDAAGKSTGTGITETISLQAETFLFTFNAGPSGTPQTVGWDCTRNIAVT
jgi:type VI protein secretion system component Hcp